MSLRCYDVTFVIHFPDCCVSVNPCLLVSRLHQLTKLVPGLRVVCFANRSSKHCLSQRPVSSALWMPERPFLPLPILASHGGILSWQLWTTFSCLILCCQGMLHTFCNDGSSLLILSCYSYGSACIHEFMYICILESLIVYRVHPSSFLSSGVLRLMPCRVSPPPPIFWRIHVSLVCLCVTTFSPIDLTSFSSSWTRKTSSLIVAWRGIWSLCIIRIPQERSRITWLVFFSGLNSHFCSWEQTPVIPHVLLALLILEHVCPVEFWSWCVLSLSFDMTLYSQTNACSCGVPKWVWV